MSNPAARVSARMPGMVSGSLRWVLSIIGGVTLNTGDGFFS
jgi:hypothetical protein